MLFRSNAFMKIRGIHHVKLTVSDLARSKKFYSKIPGFKVVAEYPDFVMFGVGDANVGLTTHDGKLSSDRFDELSVGLDHFAVKLASEVDLLEAIAFLDSVGIEHSGIKASSNGVKIVVFRDPDNIQLEFAAKSK